MENMSTVQGDTSGNPSKLLTSGKASKDGEEKTTLAKLLEPFVNNGRLKSTNNVSELLEALIKLLNLLGQNIIDEELEDIQIGTKRDLAMVSTVQEVIKAVKDARNCNHVLRVVGSEHSALDSIYPKGEHDKTLLLIGSLRDITSCEVKKENGEDFLYCTAGGGCYIGYNPRDAEAEVEDSLSYFIQKKGFAFPVTGGITHQTVAGYMVTGADGGTIQHCFADTIMEIEFVNGLGKVVTVRRDVTDPDNKFNAVGVSLGLLGVITSVRFRFPKTYHVEGYVETTTFDNSMLGPNNSQCKNKFKLRESIESNEFFHLNWFPQKNLNRVQHWVGQKVPVGEHTIAFVHELAAPIAAFGAAFVLRISDEILNNENLDEDVKNAKIVFLLQLFTMISGPKEFRDSWEKTLPSDNQVPVDTIIKVDFTEVWLPLEHCDVIMDRLTKLYAGNIKAAGNFATEIYSAKKSPFWLSMAYGRNVVRVDPYWWHYNKGDMREYYSYVWDELMDLDGARCHWGKHLPENNQKFGKGDKQVTFNRNHLMSSYPKMKEWLEYRDAMDPYQVFVTEYWRGILEIPVRCNETAKFDLNN